MNMKTNQARHLFKFLLAIILVASSFTRANAGEQPRLSDYIRPMVGTQGGEGNT
jgi:hypothetical protein